MMLMRLYSFLGKIKLFRLIAFEFGRRVVLADLASLKHLTKVTRIVKCAVSYIFYHLILTVICLLVYLIKTILHRKDQINLVD